MFRHRFICLWAGVAIWLSSETPLRAQYQPWAIQWLQHAFNPQAGRDYLGIYGTNINSAFTNLFFTVPKWQDLLVNYAFSTVGPTAPSLVSVTNPASDSVIKALGFDNNDELFGTAQLPHNIAITNKDFPFFYTEPHVHFDCIKAGLPSATASNVTWRIEWEWADINGTWQRGTNQATMGVTNNFRHYMMELGHITNNPPLSISAIFRCRLTRPASSVREYDSGAASHTVLLNAFDLHVPVGNRNAIGSSNDNSP